jgi:hypothetical protein
MQARSTISLWFLIQAILLPLAFFVGAFRRFFIYPDLVSAIILLSIAILMLCFFGYAICALYVQLEITKSTFTIKRPLFKYIGLRKKAHREFQLNALFGIRIRESAGYRAAPRGFIWKLISIDDHVVMKFEFTPEHKYEFLTDLVKFFEENAIPTRLFIKT